MQKDNQIDIKLTEALQSASQVEVLLKKLSDFKADDLQSVTNSQQYLDFLGTIIYILNCSAHSYAHIKSLQIPEQFNKVKQYYTKVKAALNKQQQQYKKMQGLSQPVSKINKQAANRMIKRNIE